VILLVLFDSVVVGVVVGVVVKVGDVGLVSPTI